MKRFREENGLTFFGLVLSMGIAGIILPLLGGMIYLLLFNPGKAEADINTQQDLLRAIQWLTIDANSAESFSTAASSSTEVVGADNFETGDFVGGAGLIASDDFESGGFAGGTGWTGVWSASGEAAVITNEGPNGGSNHLRLSSSTGYAERVVNLSSQASSTLTFWAKLASFDGAETASLLVSSDGVGYSMVRTWVNGEDDDTYRAYTFDLSSYTSSSTFYIAFDAEMTNDDDKFFVDDLRVGSSAPVSLYTAYTAPTVGLNDYTSTVSIIGNDNKVARDSFESGSLSGGAGWVGDWNASGEALVTIAETPYAGSYHLRLLSSTGYAERVVDLSNASSPTLTFWAKDDSFDGAETASLKVSSDGVSYTTLRTWVDGEDDKVYRKHSFDLSAYNPGSTFYIAFDADMGDSGDKFYVDSILVTRDVEPFPTPNQQYLDPGVRNPYMRNLGKEEGHLLHTLNVYPSQGGGVTTLAVNWVFTLSGSNSKANDALIRIFLDAEGLTPGRVANCPAVSMITEKKASFSGIGSFNVQFDPIEITQPGTYSVAFCVKDVGTGTLTTNAFKPSGAPSDTWVYAIAFKDYKITATSGNASVTAYVRQVPGPTQPPTGDWSESNISWITNQVTPYQWDR